MRGYIRYINIVMWWLFGMVSVIPVTAQVVQRGMVLEMSSGRKPVPGVEVRAVGAAPSDSDMKGMFELDFSTALPGDPLLLDRVYKKGFEMVNREKVNQWNLSADAVMEVVLGRKEVIDSLRRKYYRIGISAAEKEYRKSLNELETRKRIWQISEEEYACQLDSLSRVQIKLRKQLDSYAAIFACINRDELDSIEKQALDLLDKGDVEGAICLYENMHTDSVLTQRIIGKKAADEDLQLLLPSLVNSFNMMKQIGDAEGCDSVGRLICSTAKDIRMKLGVVEWRFSNGDRNAALDDYGLLIKEAQTVSDVEQIQASLLLLLDGMALSKTIKKKVDLLKERISARMNWARIKENSRINE